MILVQDADLTIHVGDALDVLRSMPDGSVDCVVTSPPYWGLRDYGTGAWCGGDPDCDHLGKPFRTKAKLNENWGTGYADVKNAEDREPMRAECCKCGATRVDQQLGLEATPELFVANMVAVFREVRRVLSDTGTLWLNLGDSYAAQGGSKEAGVYEGKRVAEADWMPQRTPPAGLKAKDLVGIPWRVAFALQADGWYLRSDIIWSKPNPMPESVTDRPTKAHEYVFLLSKGPRYWFDQEAVREPAEYGRRQWSNAEAVLASATNGHDTRANHGVRMKASVTGSDPSAGRNIRSVWEIATQPYAEAHFATFPEELARRCILAGCPEWVCGTCRKPRERVTDVEYIKSPVHGAGSVVGRHYTTGANGYDGAGMPRLNKQTTTVGWSDCGHDNYRPGTVLDPFGGSGTTGLVARKHGRRAVLIELNPEYARLAAARCSQLSLLAELG